MYIYIYYMESIIGEWYDQLSAYNDTASTTNHSTVRCSLPCLVGQQISGSKCLCWTALEFWHWATDPWSPLSNVHQVQFNRIPPPLNIAGWIHRCQTCGGSGSSSPGRDTITCPVRLDEEVLLEMDILWSSHDHPMIILWSSYDHPMIILWSSYDHPMIILWSFYDHPMIPLRRNNPRQWAIVRGGYLPRMLSSHIGCPKFCWNVCKPSLRTQKNSWMSNGV